MLNMYNNSDAHNNNYYSLGANMKVYVSVIGTNADNDINNH